MFMLHFVQRLPDVRECSFKLNETVSSTTKQGTADEEEEGEKREALCRTPITVLGTVVFIAFTMVSAYIDAPTLRILEQSLDASEQNV